MKIQIANIPEEGSTFEGSEPAGILQLEGDPFVKPLGGVDYTLYAQPVSDELVVRGELSAKVALKCSRCLEFFSTTVTDSDFLRAYPTNQEMDHVDLTEDIREDLLLSLPGFPVCSEDCKGLCIQCGMDLNQRVCGCRNETVSDAWQALDDLNL